MAKFGLFKFGQKEPLDVYEGGHMQFDKGYVSIFRSQGTAFDIGYGSDLIHAIHLDKGYRVSETEPTKEPDEPKTKARRRSRG
jgi:hypothetical protein